MRDEPDVRLPDPEEAIAALRSRPGAARALWKLLKSLDVDEGRLGDGETENPTPDRLAPEHDERVTGPYDQDADVEDSTGEAAPGGGEVPGAA